MNEESHKIASNTVLQIIGRVVVLIISLGSIKLVTNYIGPEGNGYYNTIITFLTFFITLGELGLFSVGVREISKHPEEKEKILGNILTIRFLTALLAVLISIAVVMFTHYSPMIKYGVMVAALFPFFNLLSSIYDMYFQFKLDMQKVALAEVISRIIAFLTILAAFVFNLGFYVVVFSVSLNAVSMFLIKWLYARKDIKINFKYDKKTINWILKASLPLGIVFIVNNIYFKLDTLILFYIKGAAEVGIYAVAYRVLETTVFAASFLSYSMKPLLSTSVEDQKELSGRVVSKGLNFLLFMSLVITVASIPFAKSIIIFLSNSEFQAGAGALVILSLASILIYQNVLVTEVMIAKDMRKKMIFMSLTVLIFNFVSNVILIPKYSFIAAAWTTFASEVLLFSIGYYFIHQVLPIKIDFVRTFKLIFVALISIALGFILQSTGLNFLISLLTTVGFYLLFSYLLDAVPKNMINDYLLSVKNKFGKK